MVTKRLNFHINVLCEFKFFFNKKNYVLNSVDKWKNIPTNIKKLTQVVFENDQNFISKLLSLVLEYLQLNYPLNTKKIRLFRVAIMQN